MRQAAIDIAREASRKVSIFTHDLEPGIYDDPDFLEVVKHLAADPHVLANGETELVTSLDGVD